MEFTAWKGFAASVPGSGHIRRDVPCQDASLVTTAERPAMIVCDGRGSAAHSHFGSQAAVKMFRSQVAILEPMIASILDREDASEENWRNFCRIMYRTLAQVKLDLADEYHLPEKEFDFTVAFAITGKSFIGCFQVGDGAIVLSQNGICETAFLPEKGEFANQTTFLRSGCDTKKGFQAKLFETAGNSGIAITSDGPEHLMFKLSEMIPGKVFDAMFDDLSGEKFNRQDILNYLTDRRWDDDPRGSDDRSLAIIVPTRMVASPGDDKTESSGMENENEPCVEVPETSTQLSPAKKHNALICGSHVAGAVLLAISIAYSAVMFIENENLQLEIGYRNRQISFLNQCLRNRNEKYRSLFLENQKLNDKLKKHNIIKKGKCK